MDKIRVGAVSYLNTKPLLYGVERSDLKNSIELITDYPASIAQQLLDDQIDVGLVPVAIIPKMQQHFIISDYCIGATGPVGSVGIFSEKPIDALEKVLLDYQSRTSVNLAKLLLKQHWKKEVVFEQTGEGYQDQIQGTTGGVVIGDRAFEQRKKSTYTYDLAEAWIAYTGLPFVFAAWIANKKLPENFIRDFNAANQFGLDRLDEVIAANPFSSYDLDTYYRKNISYNLDAAKKKGLDRFIDELKSVQ